MKIALDVAVIDDKLRNPEIHSPTGGILLQTMGYTVTLDRAS